MSGGERVDDTPVHKALREALANCLINVDYHGLRGVVIRKESDKLILENPGYVRTGKKQMCLGGESAPRNKALMKMFNLINIGERAGSGVPNIFNVWEDEGWEKPVIEEKFDPDRTVLTLSFVKNDNKKLNEDANLIQKMKEVLNLKDYEKTLPIIEYLENNASITTQTVKLITGKLLATAWRYIQILIKADVLEADGNTNNAEYVLKTCNKDRDSKEDDVMGLIEVASGNSVWRGMDYYNDKKVKSWKNAGDGIYEGIVSGSGDNKYMVYIDKNHPRKSTCNCPFADGRRVVCKHMIALYFTAEPQAAVDFMKEVEQWEAEEELREQEHYEDLKRYVKSLTKAELQEQLLNALVQLEERRNYW